MEFCRSGQSAHGRQVDAAFFIGGIGMEAVKALAEMAGSHCWSLIGPKGL